MPKKKTAKKPGRKKTPEADAKTSQILIRVSPAFRDAVRQQAELSGMTVTEYSRLAIERMAQEPDQIAIAELAHHLREATKAVKRISK